MKRMMTKPPSTLMFVLRWHGLQLLGGLAMLALSAGSLYVYHPDPPGAPYVSLAAQVQPWLGIAGLLFGGWNAISAWRKGSKLRNG